MRLAALLLALIAVTHYSYDLLAMAYADQAQAARAIFYVLRGMEGAALFLVVWLLVRGPVVGLVCLWGAIEEAQTSVCRLAQGIGEVPGYEPFVGLCGRGLYFAGVIAAAAFAAWIGRQHERHD